MAAQQLSIDRNELYVLLKEAVRDVLHEEIFEIYLKSVPAVSKKEMQDIMKIYGKPSSAKKIARSETIEI